ncbi:SGS-domain-containing protein [Amniculicola lignicola CBS 123094]|uniref:SGS-domain-containing protein n=1 Tax=Amniculicola lignicola CBS 123094 TaxID=1392246 RepID=A0A6A5W8U7_9PLEO|nr:SGS-domain-containing protein [Amniculicola lignicola CBS 123094]
MDQAARGAAALTAGNYDEAIKEYTGAIASNSSAVDYYIKRSTAYQRTSKYQDALADAELAVVLAHKRAKRELIKDSQLRRAIALFFVERYADAQFVLGLVKKLDEKEKTLAIWSMKVEAKLKGLEEGDERGVLAAKEIPEVELPVASSAKVMSKAEGKKPVVEAEKKPVVPTPANKIKHDWYQDNEKVVFSLLAKGVPKDKASVEIEKDSLSISFPILDSSDYSYSLDPFFAEIDASSSSFRITPTKIEVTLKKAQPGVKWKALEGDAPLPSSTSPDTNNKSTIPSHVLTDKTNDSPPAYPTSSRKGAKNWDKLAEDLTAKKPKKDGEAGEGDEVADDGLDEFEGDETTRFFKQLYKGASAEQQRAMMKSYQESGGTVLSTDWSNVGSRTVVPEPPDGMEARKYGT